MANIKMARVDYRLVHGQIVAKWIKFRPVKRLIVVDNDLVNDPFMGDIYRMAAPGYEVDIVDVNSIQESLDKKNDDVMLIFKDVDLAYQAVRNNLELKELNIGAVPSNKDRTSLIQGVALSEDEYEKLLDLENKNIHVFLQPIPETEPVQFGSVKNKFK